MLRTRHAAILGALMALVGCTLTQSELRKGAALLPTVGSVAGPAIVPRQCALRMAILERPANDPVLGETLWNVADVQALDEPTRRSLATNGLRIGIVTGDLPREVQEVLDAPPPHQVNPATVILPDGDSTLVDLEAKAPELNLLLALQQRNTVEGKRYADAHGFLRLSARLEDGGAVDLSLAPELHHGPVRQGWGVASGGGSLAPQQFVVHNGQTEETFRDLAVGLSLRPGQVAVASLEPGRKGSLGHFLFSRPETNSDRLLHRYLLVWASPFEGGKDSLGGEAPAVPASVPPALEPVDPPEMPAAARPVETSFTRPRNRHRRPSGPELAMTDH